MLMTDMTQAPSTRSGKGPAPSAYVLLASGSYVDLLNPHPNSWTDHDLSERLSRTPRWAGSSKWPLPLSVAQHALLTLSIALWNNPALPKKQQLFILLHDAEEGFLGFDCITPLKTVLGPGLKKVAHDLMSAVLTRYHAVEPTGADYDAYKLADRTAASSEAFHIVGWSERQIRDLLGLTTPILSVDPLHSQYQSEERREPWEPWEPRYAATRYLEALHSLTKQVEPSS